MKFKKYINEGAGLEYLKSLGKLLIGMDLTKKDMLNVTPGFVDIDDPMLQTFSSNIDKAKTGKQLQAILKSMELIYNRVSNSTYMKIGKKLENKIKELEK